MGAYRPARDRDRWRRGAVTLCLGVGIIAAAEMLLLLDVGRRGVAVLPPGPGAAVAAPAGALETLARLVAVDMTPLCWAGFLLLADGVLTMLGAGAGAATQDAGGSPARLRPRRFWTCFVTGVGVWLFFDWVNFQFIHAWDYHGLGEVSRAHQYVAKFIAFGAISPAMFLTAEGYRRLGLRRARGRGLPLGTGWQLAMFAAGVPALLFPFVVGRPVGATTLWLSLVLILDPLNAWLGRGRVPTLIGDWRAGRYGRTLSLMAGGLTCGLLWEFWNYWAAAKWTYHLPFLGAMEHVKLFEMPLAGFGGFPPFALECWVVFQSILLAMGALGLRFVEKLPDDAVL